MALRELQESRRGQSTAPAEASEAVAKESAMRWKKMLIQRPYNDSNQLGLPMRPEVAEEEGASR